MTAAPAPPCSWPPRSPRATAPGGDAQIADPTARLAGGLWDEVASGLDAHEGWGRPLVALPRFSLASDETLTGPLREMGATDTVDPRTADLSRLSRVPSRVQFVRESTFVAVNEKGTEAAAVTTGAVGADSVGPHSIADRPSVFVGRVAAPR